MTERLKKQLANLPTRPGVYIFRDARAEVLYVGKAKNLRNRVRSYFQRTRERTPEKDILVREIKGLETIIVRSETDALLLEATLIKRHQPPHNIVLVDDSSFLFVRIFLDDPFPPVSLVRRVAKDRARYFGPYTSAKSIRQTLKLLRRIFPYRTCADPPDRPCFDAQLGRCAGHDLTPASRKEYQSIIHGLIRFLEGHGSRIVRQLRSEMRAAAAGRQYEQAAVARDRLRAVERVLGRQVVVSPRGENEDIISFARAETKVLVNLFRVRQGKLVEREQFTLRHVVETPDADVLAAFLEQYYSQTADHPKTVLVPVEPTERTRIENALQLRISVPQRGRKRRLIDMGTENARLALTVGASTKANEQARRRKALSDLAAYLGLPRPPQRIECYDISNVQGVHPVGSMVVVENGLPVKAAYRKFGVRTVQGSDDFRMLAEVVGRRLQHPDWPRPDLIVLDGGKGQLAVVRRTVTTDVPLVALAKREEELYLPDRSAPLRLPRDSEALFLLQRLRDEAHRFAVGYFRKLHGREGLRSSLDDISGIGPKTRKLLITRFGSLRAIRSASLDELVRVVGQKRAEQIQKSY